MSTKLFNLGTVLTECKKSPTCDERKAALIRAVAASPEYGSLVLLGIFAVRATSIYAIAKFPDQPAMALTIKVGCSKAKFQDEAYCISFHGFIAHKVEDFSGWPAMPVECLDLASAHGLSLSADCLQYEALMAERARPSARHAKGTLLEAVAPFELHGCSIEYAVTQDAGSRMASYLSVKKGIVLDKTRNFLKSSFRVVNTSDLPRLRPRTEHICLDGYLFKLINNTPKLVGVAISDDEYLSSILVSQATTAFSSGAWLS